MSDTLDDLTEAARNRGLRLVRSRVRTPGKRGFGKVGLTGPNGAPMLGMDGDRPSADPAEVEAHLRALGASDWSGSLSAKDKKLVKRKAEPLPDEPGPEAPRPSPKRVKQTPTTPAPAAEDVPDSPPKIRPARSEDAPALVDLVAALDHQVDAAGVRDRVRSLARAGEAPLVAIVGREIVGLCGLHRMTAIHRTAPVGRVTILVVAEAARGRGIGRMLIEAAEAELRNAGCALIEITSNDRLTKAHAFYRHLGFQRTSMRFCKALD